MHRASQIAYSSQVLLSTETSHAGDYLSSLTKILMPPTYEMPKVGYDMVLHKQDPTDLYCVVSHYIEKSLALCFFSGVRQADCFQLIKY